jgi:hypothetical protein
MGHAHYLALAYPETILVFRLIDMRSEWDGECPQ